MLKKKQTMEEHIGLKAFPSVTMSMYTVYTKYYDSTVMNLGEVKNFLKEKGLSGLYTNDSGGSYANVYFMREQPDIAVKIAPLRKTSYYDSNNTRMVSKVDDRTYIKSNYFEENKDVFEHFLKEGCIHKKFSSQQGFPMVHDSYSVKVIHEETDMIIDILQIIVMKKYHKLDGIMDKGVFDEKLALGIAADILNVLGKIHSINIIHRDISIRNVMYDEVEKRAVLIDWGTSKLGSQGYTRTKNGMNIITYGTPGFYDPIRLDATADGRNENNPLIDLYSVGVLLYYFENGQRLNCVNECKSRPDFNENEMDVAFDNSLIPRFNEHTDVPDEYKDIVKKAIEHRFASVDEMLQAVNQRLQMLESRNDAGKENMGMEYVRSLEQKVEELERSVETVTQETVQLKNENRKLNEKSIQLENENNDLKNTNGRINSVNNDLKNKTLMLENHNNTLENENEKLKKENEELKTIRQNLLNRIMQLQGDMPQNEQKYPLLKLILGSFFGLCLVIGGVGADTQEYTLLSMVFRSCMAVMITYLYRNQEKSKFKFLMKYSLICYGVELVIFCIGSANAMFVSVADVIISVVIWFIPSSLGLIAKVVLFDGLCVKKRKVMLTILWVVIFVGILIIDGAIFEVLMQEIGGI